MFFIEYVKNSKQEQQESNKYSEESGEIVKADNLLQDLNQKLEDKKEIQEKIIKM